MISGVGLRQIDYLWPILIGGLIVFLILTWIEILRNDKHLRFLRIASVFFAINSLVLLALKPYYNSPNDEDLTIVFTEGSTRNDSLIGANPTANFIYWSDTVQSNHLSSNLIIDGFGLPIYDLYKIEDYDVTYLNTDLPKGIIDVFLPETVEVGEELEVYLKLNDVVNHKFVLSRLGEKCDSVNVVDVGETVKLNAVFKAEGRFLLEIQEYDENNILVNTELLPINVIPSNRLNILLLNTFPTFETRFLKQFFEKADRRYFVRNEISTDKYLYENSETLVEEMPLINEFKLKSFDLVIVNAAQLSKIRNSEREALGNAVKENGLGILILAGEDELNQKLPNWANFHYKTDKLESFEYPYEKEKLLISTSAYRYLSSGLSETIFKDNGGDIAQTRPWGLGRIAITSLYNTYELVLSGNQKGYQNLWKILLESCLKPKNETMIINSLFNFINQPMDFQYLVSDSMAVINYDSLSLPMKQDRLVQNIWSSKIWPLNTGWNSLSEKNADNKEHWFYVYPDSAFLSKQYSDRIVQNKKSANISKTVSNTQKMMQSEISLWWFYLIFIMSMAYLWLQPKLK